jgi:rRNA maturation protein Nop10
MSYCPKCGNKVDETMTFCPRCGASLKMEAPSRPSSPQPAYQPTIRRNEKSEKGEKQEKNEPEKGEKNEKREHGHIGWLIAGTVVIIIGILAFLRASNIMQSQFESPITLVVVGVAVIIIAFWLSSMAKKRNPTPA